MATDKPIYTSVLDEDVAEEVDEFADRRDMSTSEAMNELVKQGLGEIDWTVQLSPIFKEATNVSSAFALLVPLLMLFFTDHPMEDAFLLAMVFVMVAVAAALLAIHFAEDPDEVFG